MFNLFKPKPKRKRGVGAQAKTVLIDGVSTMLLALQVTAGRRSVEDDNGDII